MRRIYLDHAATTPVDSRVREAMAPLFEETFGNPSSIHWHGREARSALEGARGTLAACLGARPGEVIFTSGGTESDNFAIQGVFRAFRKKGRPRILTTAAEHHAVLDCVEVLREEGAEVSILPVDGYGRVLPEVVGGAVDERTCLVTIMHANNEVGTISDLAAISAAVHGKGALLHSDAVQSFGTISVGVEALGVDLLSVSAHKIYGPKGIGALYVRAGTPIENLFWGGGQERGRRPGTENVALAVGFARAAEIAVAEIEDRGMRAWHLRDSLEEKLLSVFPALRVNGDPRARLPHLLHVSFGPPGTLPDGEMLPANMDLEGVAVSSGSACTSGSVQPSHVLIAMGLDEATARASLRFSFGRSNSEEDVEEVVAALRRVVSRMGGKA